MRGQIIQGLIEIGLCRGCDAIRVLTQEDLVHIEFKDALFVQGLFDAGRQDDFFDLTLDLTIP